MKNLIVSNSIKLSFNFSGRCIRFVVEGDNGMRISDESPSKMLELASQLGAEFKNKDIVQLKKAAKLHDKKCGVISEKVDRMDDDIDQLDNVDNGIREAIMEMGGIKNGGQIIRDLRELRMRVQKLNVKLDNQSADLQHDLDELIDQ